jgi:hypothetical protein
MRLGQGEPNKCNLYETGTRLPYQTVRLFIEDDIILLGVEVILSGLMTRSMMLWTLWLSGTKRHIELMTPDDGTDKLDADLRAQDAAMAKLQSTVAENKKASGEIKKSLDNLEAATEKLQEG